MPGGMACVGTSRDVTVSPWERAVFPASGQQEPLTCSWWGHKGALMQGPCGWWWQETASALPRGRNPAPPPR